MTTVAPSTGSTNALGLAAGRWTIDPAHATAAFTVRHLMITKVTGRFADVKGDITITEDPLHSSVTATIGTASLDSGDAGRDAHLRSADFLDIETHPEIKFQSTAIRPAGDGYIVTGGLTVKEVTKPVELALEFDGVIIDPWGNTKAGFSAVAEINRKDWGLEWNVALETGGVVVGEKVKIQTRYRSSKGLKMKIHELGHVVLYVRNLARSRTFYRDVLGFRELHAIDNAMAAYSSGRTHHELLLIQVGDAAAPLPRGRRVGMYHIGLKVGESDDELREALATVQRRRCQDRRQQRSRRHAFALHRRS